MKYKFTSLFLIAAVVFIAPFTSSDAKENAPASKQGATLAAPLPADEALSKLKDGNQRFTAGKVRSDGQAKKDILRLSTSQAPSAVVLSCSDSRVPPEMVFDQKLGEVFTVRTAGETLSPEAIGSIEYAIANLGSRLIVVMGHTNCGAVKAAIETIGGKSLGSENLDKLVADIHPRIKPMLKPEISKDLRDESWASANGSAKDLVARSKIIASAVQSGKAKIVVGLYDLASGKVEFK